ncbi:MAG: GNAT family N-acetyltransferase [Clostridiales bacterium]|jgi:aminoglycoside 6'-N-acetyltransferase I|nr:GNAT family N-acetyltransferase [Clostridiales bacterium]
MLFLRACTKDDIQDAAQLMCAVYAEPPFNEQWQYERAKKRITAFLSGIGAKGYSLNIETQVVGYLFGRMDYTAKGDVFYVQEIFVNPAYQRKGCGSMAMEQLRDELRKEGVTKIELHTLTEDISFYEKNGFSPSSYLYLEKKI